MYYAIELFVKKGKLSKLWIAGTVPRKLSRRAVMTSDITRMCKDIDDPPTPLALPTQSTLLRGVVRIENKKTRYVLSDAVSAQTRLRLLTKPQARVNLPKRQLKASKESITMAAPDLSFMVLEDDDLASLLMGDKADFDVLDQGIPIDLSYQHDKYRQQGGMLIAKAEDITMADQKSLDASLDIDLMGLEDLDFGDLGGSGEQEDLEAPLDYGPLAMDEPQLPGEDQKMMEQEEELMGLDFGDIFEEQKSDQGLDSSGSVGTAQTAEAALAQADRELKLIEAEEDKAAAAAAAKKKRGRKRKAYTLRVDKVTELSDKIIRRGLKDTRDIVCEKREPKVTIKTKKAELQRLDKLLRTPFLDVLKGKRFKAIMADAMQVDAGQEPVEGRDEQAEEVHGGLMAGEEFDLDFGDFGDVEKASHGASSAGVSDVEYERAERRRMSEMSAFDVEMPRAYESDAESVVSRSSFLGINLNDFGPEEESRAKRRRVSHGVDEELPFEDMESEVEAGSKAGGSPRSVASRSSMRSLRSSRRGSDIGIGLLEDDFATPNLDVPESQFSIPLVTEGDQAPTSPQPHKMQAIELEHITEVFRAIIERAFEKKAKEKTRKGKGEPKLQFYPMLKQCLEEANEVGPVSREDLSRSFMQLLTLKTLGVVDVDQPEPYGTIAVTKGPKWKLTFSNSQLWA